MTSSPPTLYHVPKTISSPIYQALIELELVGNPVRVQTMEFPDLKSVEHLARNPMGTSPTFCDPEHDIAIWESGAVATYILETYDTSGVLHPRAGVSSRKLRASFLHEQQFIVATVYPFVASLYLHSLKPKEEQDKEYIKDGIKTWRKKLAPVLVMLLGDQPYFGGETFNWIDLVVGKPLNNAKSLGALCEFPTLLALFEKIKSRPSFAAAYGLEHQVAAGSDESRSLILLPGEKHMRLLPGDDKKSPNCKT